ncbi:hypothetical protein DPMN_000502 [Dreissena polymorpha]|uniref:Uncharacterized protein n=1 Tax=Dreissena polymorpha TaxID=45954 RepID=A0A9D4MJ45_DREPO|nr:hypothetical protein DPMN_000502 [Dreissena polymorpha]
MNHRCKWKSGERGIIPRLLVIRGVVCQTRGFLKTTMMVTQEKTVMTVVTDGQYTNVWERRPEVMIP